MTRRPQERLDTLDGLRALAVAAVVLYHYCYFWTPAGNGYSLIAYGDALSGLPFVNVGYLGVHLFFVISGFVILLTLERTSSLKEFLLRRTLRLWPALLIFGTMTFAIVSMLGPEELRVGWWEYVLSLVILPPQHVGMLLGASGWKWLDGAYWSLFVEVKFYIVIGFLFFAFPQRVITAWIAFELATLVIGLQTYAVGGQLWHMLDGLVFQPFVPYFSFGLAAYANWSGRGGKAVQLLAALAILHAALVLVVQLVQHPPANLWISAEVVAGQAIIFAVFYLFAWRRVSLSFLGWPPLVRAGRASYGIYLLHQNVGVAVLSIPLFAAPLVGVGAALLTFAAIVLIAVLVYEHVEHPLQTHLKQRLFQGGLQPHAALGQLALARKPGSALVRPGVRQA